MAPVEQGDAAGGRLLLLVTPELAGVDVATAQRELLAAGDDPGPLDGVYGPTTAAAVRAFQRGHGLRVDGIVGPQTALALASSPVPAKPEQNAPGPGALAWMAARLGMDENPPGSNDNEITREFGMPGQPWCCMTVSLAYKHGAGIILGSSTQPPPWGYWPDRGFAYVPAMEAWLKSAGFWIGVTRPAPGDIACYIVPGETVQPGHTGLVESVEGPGRFYALEGNYDNQLARVARTVDEVTGFGRIRRTT